MKTKPITLLGTLLIPAILLAADEGITRQQDHGYTY